MKGIYDGNTLIATFSSDPLEALRQKVNLHDLSADEDYIYLGEEPIFSIAPIPDEVGTIMETFLSALRTAYRDLLFAVEHPSTYDEGRIKSHADGIQAVAELLKGKPAETFSIIALGFRLFSEREFMKIMGEAQKREFLSALEKIITSLEKSHESRKSD